MKQKIKLDKGNAFKKNKKAYISILIFLITIFILLMFINIKYNIKGEILINKSNHNEISIQDGTEDELGEKNHEELESKIKKESLDKANYEIKRIDEKIHEILNEEEKHYGVYYYDLDTGCEYSLNGDKEFQAASTMKVPIAMMIADKLSRNELEEDTLIEYTVADKSGGAGVLEGDVSEGDKLKVIDLLEYMIEESDNVATSMLKRNVGNICDYITNLTSIKVDNENNFITPKQSCMVLKTLYNKSHEDIYYQKIIDFMKATTTHDRLDKYINHNIIAHKIGDYENYVNDVGIMYTQRPYILAIYTEDVMEEGRENIAQISKIIYDIKTEN